MKQCPECKRVYYDNSLKFCLEDGATLSETQDGEPVTAILPGEIPASELPTRQHETTGEDQEPTAVDRVKNRSTGHGPFNKAWLALVLPVLVLAVGFLLYRYWNNTDGGKQINSIAVIPFENLNANPDTDYLSEGISEALINSLTELQQIKVVARSTAFRYKGKDIDPKTVGRELNVGSVLMGHVRQVGDSIDVQVDLVDTSSGIQLWGQEYERSLSDVVTIKQTIAREVTEKLRLRLTGDQEQRLAHRDTTDPVAFQSYLRGRYYWNKRTADNLRKAADQFQQAIDHDPNFALGYVGLADCYLLLEQWADAYETETLPKAREAVQKALQLDDSLAEAHTSLANVHMGEWRWAEAESEYDRAITLNPNYPTAHLWLCTYFRVRRQFDNALRECKRAQELDPVLPTISRQVAHVYLLSNDLNSALEEGQKAVELDPSFPSAHTTLGFAYLKLHRYAEALPEFQKAAELSGRTSLSLSELGYTYAVTGKRNEALQILKELEERYAKHQAIGQYPAAVHVGLGGKDRAISLLENDFNQHSSQLPYITYAEVFEDLRGDPRFADLVRRMGLQS